MKRKEKWNFSFKLHNIDWIYFINWYFRQLHLTAWYASDHQLDVMAGLPMRNHKVRPKRKNMTRIRLDKLIVAWPCFQKTNIQIKYIKSCLKLIKSCRTGVTSWCCYCFSLFFFSLFCVGAQNLCSLFLFHLFHDPES